MATTPAVVTVKTLMMESRDVSAPETRVALGTVMPRAADELAVLVYTTRVSPTEQSGTLMVMFVPFMINLSGVGGATML